MKNLLSDLIALVIVLIPMMLSAAVISGLAYLVAEADRWVWYDWLIAAPVLYVCWLLVFLIGSALTCRQLGRRYPKPRYKAYYPGRGGPRNQNLGLLTALVCYRRGAMIASLPLVPILEQSSWLRKLVLHAYSPSVHIGKALNSWGYMYDPDLTLIGDDVVIGGRAAIAAHSVTTRRNSELVYVSAPIRIGDRATIGGEARVALGCVIEEDAVIEPGSVLPPFTRIPAGEVWGGNPACFRRRRDDVDDVHMADLDRDSRRPSDPLTDSGIRPLDPRDDGSAVDEDEIRKLVVEALDLSPDQASADLNSYNLSAWDSLGQIAIASAIFDRYGLSVNENHIYRLHTLADVAGAVADVGKSSVEAQSEHGVVVHGTEAANGIASHNGTLPDDVELLPLLDHQEATRALAGYFQGGPPAEKYLSVTIAASFTAEPLATSLKLWGRAFGLECGCEFVGSDQLVQALLDDSGPIVSNDGGITVVLVRPEDLATDSDESGTERMEQVLGALTHCATTRVGPGPILVGTLPPVTSVFASIDSERAEELRDQWRTRLRNASGIKLFDFAGVVDRVGIEAARSSGSEVLMRAPFSSRLYQELGIALVRHIRASHKSPAKVVAVDCDNTLWGGIVGEVGVGGIELGSDGVGRGYQLFQRYLKRLRDRGLLLVIVSKNEERDVRAVFEQHPEMILRSDDILAWRVNWQPKSQNLEELAEHLNLGIDSFVFIDDDPAVRLEVKTHLPEVHVVPLPEDPAAYCATLDRLWLFDNAQTTAIDAVRADLMRHENRRQQEHKSAASLEEFLLQLDLRVQIGPPAEPEWARVAQLTQRTNQFNLSLKRRTTEEVRLQLDSASVWVLRAWDRFGDYGLVGVCIVRLPDKSMMAEIDTLLLSCRALGRGVEEAFLHGIVHMTAEQGAATLVAPFVEGPRNKQVEAFLARGGFVEVNPKQWTLALTCRPPLPEHVQLHMPDWLESTSA